MLDLLVFYPNPKLLQSADLERHMQNRWNVLIPSEIYEGGPESIRDIAEFETYDITGSKDDLISRIKDYDAIILRTVEMDRDVIEAAENLQVISKHGVGVDMIDIEAASEEGIVVCNTPGANATAVAEHAIALTFSCWKGVVKADKAVRDGNWDKARHDNNRAERRDLRSQTMGLFGCGNIGSEAGKMAQSFGMDCIVYDPYVNENDLPDGFELISEKSLFFASADVVSVHTPLTEETESAISRNELNELGESGIIVNTSRGGIIDEDALLDALKTNKIAGAALDVLSYEPPSENHPLLCEPNVILTPHCGGMSRDAFEEMSLRAAENVRTVREGKLPKSTLNVHAFEDKD